LLSVSFLIRRVSVTQALGQVLGEAMATDTWALAPRGQYDGLMPYAVIIGLGALVLGGWFWWRKRRGKPNDAI
jgi:LPXTG-motif cell wall-anchored protein